MQPSMEECKNLTFFNIALNESSIVSVVKEVESALKLRIYSHKYNILSFIYDNPNSISLDIQKNCPSSKSTFYKCLGELRDAKIILPLGSSSDMRTRRYDLSPNVKLFLEKRYKSIGKFLNKKLMLERDGELSIVRLVKSIEKEIGFSYYSPDFEILIFLYENEIASPTEMMGAASTSEASFYSTLKRLREQKIIFLQFPRKNGRQKLYRLSDRTSSILDSAHRIIVKSDLL